MMRTKNHILEDESRLFFKQSLPNYWVCRDKDKDYGIDCEVEIFDVEGNSTGMVFWVQLKATATVVLNEIMSVSFTKTKLSQFKSYELPVLIVRYSSFQKTLYMRWSNSIYVISNSKNVKLYFEKDDLWTNQTHKEIVEYLQKKILIKSGKFTFPIKIFIEKKLEVKYSVVQTLKEYLKKYNRFFEISISPDKVLLKILIEPENTIINLGDLAFTSFSIDSQDFLDNEDVKKIIVAGISNCLFQVGKNAIGSEIIFKDNLLTTLKKYKQFLITLLPNLLEGKSFIQTFEDLKSLFEDSENDDIVQCFIHFLIILKRREFDEEELRIVEVFFVQQIELAKKVMNNEAIGRSFYNLASHYRNTGNIYLAIANYLKASKYFPHYKTASYFYFELAGCFFNIGKFLLSSKFYRKALNLKSEYHITKALLADALMHNGNYGEAIQLLNEYLIEQIEYAKYNDEWYLKCSCLSIFIESGHPSTQIRDMDTAQSMLGQNRFEEALEFDLLSSLAWYNVGVLENERRNINSSFLAFTFSALLNNSDVEAWVNATLSGFNDQNNIFLLINVIRVAYYYNEDVFLNLLVDKLEGYPSSNIEVFMEVIHKTIQEKLVSPQTIRIIGEEGVFDSIVL